MTTSMLPIVKLLFDNNNPGVTKLKNTQFDSVYVCECKSMLQKEKHYMFVIGSVDVIPIGSNVQIEDINNINCIQFRTFQEPILQQVLVNRIDFSPQAGNVFIKRYNISKDTNGKKISEYMFNFESKPYNVHIFHTTDSDYEFVPDGNLLSALITWDTMLIPSINVGSPPPPPPQTHITDDMEFEHRARPQVRPRNQYSHESPLQQHPPPPQPQQQINPRPPQQQINPRPPQQRPPRPPVTRNQQPRQPLVVPPSYR
jgi:hypothetical protein